MPVETRYVVTRNNSEVKTFMDKKAADEYDKMLDIADNLTTLLKSSPVEFSDDDLEALSIYLSKSKEDLLIALQAKKPKAPKPTESSKEGDDKKSNDAIKLKKAS